MVEMTLSQYHSVVAALVPALKKLFYPHLSKIKAALQPGLEEFNWTSYHWQEFTEKLAMLMDFKKSFSKFRIESEKLMKSAVL